MGLSVLLVEPWLTGSHAAWADGLRRHSRHQVEVLSGGRQGWKATFDQSAGQLAAGVESRPDVVVASSMFNLAEFRREAGLNDSPTLMYFHENQLTYDRANPDRQRGLVNWQSAKAADAVAFNSRFHLDDFHDALPTIGVDAGSVAAARAEAVVLPVGIEIPAGSVQPGDPPTLLWNHRWEHDKDPDTFVSAISEVSDLPFRLILLGEGPRADRYHAAIRTMVGDRVVHAGFAPRPLYLELLGQSDLVVSTARQEFFGVSIAEAMAAGVVPLVPNRLAYPELLGPALTPCSYEPGSFGKRLRAWLANPEDWLQLRPAVGAAGGRFAWEMVAPAYDEIIDSIA